MALRPTLGTRLHGGTYAALISTLTIQRPATFFSLSLLRLVATKLYGVSHLPKILPSLLFLGPNYTASPSSPLCDQTMRPLISSFSFWHQTPRRHYVLLWRPDYTAARNTRLHGVTVLTSLQPATVRPVIYSFSLSVPLLRPDSTAAIIRQRRVTCVHLQLRPLYIHRIHSACTVPHTNTERHLDHSCTHDTCHFLH